MLQAQIYFDKDDRLDDQPLQQFIMNVIMNCKVVGATCFKGAAGFGSNQYLKQPGLLFSFDEPPMLITFIDDDDKVKEAIKTLRKDFKGGLIITTQVEKW